MKLLYATTIALIISNIATLVLTIVFAQALSRNIDTTLRLNKVEAQPQMYQRLRKRTIDPGGGVTQTQIEYCYGACDIEWETCVAGCNTIMPEFWQRCNQSCDNDKSVCYEDCR